MLSGFRRNTLTRCPRNPQRAKLPILGPERSEPVPTVVMPLIRKPSGDPSVAKRPEILDQTVVELPPPFCRKELDDCFPPGDKLGSVPPLAAHGAR